MPVPRDGVDHAARDLADDVVPAVGDVDIPVAVHGDAGGVAEFGGWRRVTVATVAVVPVARDRYDGAICEEAVETGLNLADHIVAGVGDEKVAFRVEREARGVVQLGIGGRDDVAAIAADSRCRRSW